MQSRMQPLSTVRLDEAYAEAFPHSRQLFARAQAVFPDGVTHDNRRMQPFPIYIERAEGADTPPLHGNDQSVDDVRWQRLDARHPRQSRAFRQALTLQGIDFNGGRALVGTCHTDDIIAETLAGFEAAVHMVKEHGLT